MQTPKMFTIALNVFQYFPGGIHIVAADSGHLEKLGLPFATINHEFHELGDGETTPFNVEFAGKSSDEVIETGALVIVVGSRKLKTPRMNDRTFFNLRREDEALPARRSETCSVP